MKYAFILSIMLFGYVNSYSQLEDCSKCNEKHITEYDLKGKTPEELRLLRNEIYARNGYVFTNQQFSNYFETKEWYRPLNDNNSVALSNIAKENIKVIKQLEDVEIIKRTTALNDLKKLKLALNNNQVEMIEKYIPQEVFRQQWGSSYDNQIKGLKNLLNKIDLNDIHWNKKCGFYNQSIDNGYSIDSYSLVFSTNDIRIGGGMIGHSSNFGDFDDGYSDYMSEGEYQSYWIFKVTKEGLFFDHLEMAG